MCKQAARMERKLRVRTNDPECIAAITPTLLTHKHTHTRLHSGVLMNSHACVCVFVCVCMCVCMCLCVYVCVQLRRTSENSLSPPGSSLGSPNRIICVSIAVTTAAVAMVITSHKRIQRLIQTTSTLLETRDGMCGRVCVRGCVCVGVWVCLYVGVFVLSLIR